MDTVITRRRLPHVDIGCAVYFLTFRLSEHQTRPLDATERTLVVEHIRRIGPGSLMAWVVMPDHVHLLYLTTTGERLATTLQALKSASAHRLAKTHDRAAPIWQHETFDRVVRDERELVETWSYIESNPVRGGIAAAADAYQWSSASSRELPAGG